MIDPLGRRSVQAIYSSDGRLVGLQDAQDQLTTMNYDELADLKVTVEDALDAETTLAFDERGNVIGVTDAAGNETQTDYENDLPTTVTQVVTSGPNLVTEFQYDAQGNVERVTDPTGSVTYVTYDRYGQPRTITDSLGNTVTNVYDDQGNLKNTTSPTGIVTTYTYFPGGNLDTVTSAANVAAFTYYLTGLLETSTDADDNTREFFYDANGNQIRSEWTWTNPTTGAIVDLHTTTEYNANDQPVRSTDAQGNSTETVFDALGRPFGTIDANGRVTEMLYDDRGLVIQTKSPTGLLTRTFYDDNGRPSYTTDPFQEGDQHVFGTHTLYTPDGQVWKTERVKDLVITLTGTAPNQRSEVQSAGTVVSTQETQYDSVGRVKLSINAYDLETQYTYNDVGQQVQVRTESLNEQGATVWLLQRTVYDLYGRVSVTTDPYLEGTPAADIYGTRTRYDDKGRVQDTDRLRGVQVDFTNNNTVLVSAGTVVSTTHTDYNDQGQVSQTIDSYGGITNYEYDDRGRPKATIGPVVVDAATGAQVRHRVETVYDANGQVWQERSNIRQAPDGTIDDSAVRVTTHAYDAFGNRVKTTFDDGSTLAWTYSNLNEVHTETDQVGNTRMLEYVDQRLAAVTLPQVPDPENNGQLTAPRYEYEYDAYGNQSVIRDALGRETTFTYDGQGHQLTRTLPLGHTEEFRYDDLGRVTLHISFEGVVTASLYDSMGRLWKKQYFASEPDYANGAGTPAETVEYSYDAFSRLVQLTSSVQGVTTWQYDPEGRITQVATPEGTINYEYDDLGRKWRMFTGSSASILDETRYAYDVLGRLGTVTVWARNGQELLEADREVTRYGYDLVGNLASVDQPNGIISVYEYDTVNRLEKLTHYLPDGTPELTDNDKLAEFDYQPRADGKWESVTETYWVTGTPQVIDVGWTYDAVGRLTDEVFNHYDDSLDYAAQYDMDLVGNRLQKTVDQGNNGSIDDYFAYGYDDNDRLLTEDQDLASGTDINLTYSYGGAGNPATYLTRVLHLLIVYTCTHAAVFPEFFR